MMKDIMLDLETVSCKPNAAIVSIGAVKFDLDTGELGDEFYCNVKASSCQDKGCHIDGDTVMWWLDQSKEAQNALMMSPKPITITEAMKAFKDFYGDYKSCNIWGNGSNFDNVILRHAFFAAGQHCPWRYSQDRDVRTLVQLAKLAGIKQHDIKREGVHHHALDDAKHQVAYCHDLWSRLRG